jgi:TonB-linked SusC/RagA family outer membrane protein
MRKLALLCSLVLLCSQLWAQTRTITGKVQDDQGNPIAGATVQAKGTNTASVTSTDGTYTISIPQKVKALIVSYIGYDRLELSIGSQTSLTFVIKRTDQSLQEVVVQVPYGTVKKTAFTGSEGTITAASLSKQQVTSVSKAIEGLVPGIVATNGGGAPGSGASIRIRGFGSYRASSAPLWVLDGIPYDGSIEALNMDDIATVTVLKDAAATALYGSRAANGVIMLTTKKGVRGRSTVTVKAVQGYMSRGIPEYNRLGSQQYYELMWEGIKNSYIYGPSAKDPATAGALASQDLTGPNGLVYNAYNVPGDQLVDPVTGKLNPSAKLLWNEPWEKALYRTAQRQNVTMSVTGAGEKNDYLFSLGYLNEDGIVKFSGNKRYNARLNVNTTPTSWFKTGISMDGSYANQSNLLSSGSYTSNPFYYTRNMGPIYPVYQHDLTTGAFIKDPTTGQNALDWGVPSQMGARPYAGNSNLLGSLALDDISHNIFNGNANTYGEVKFLKDFTFKTTFGLNYYDDYNTQYQNSQFGDAANVAGRSTKTSDRSISYTVNEILTWNKTFGDHTIRVLAGHENYKFHSTYEYAQRIGFAFPGSSELDNATTADGSGSHSDNLRIESYLSNVNYDYKGKYLLSGSYRRDGTSRFFKDNRWGNFYSAGAGWRISEEDFMKDVRWVNELKLRASYGEQGNQNLLKDDGTQNYYVYQNLYASGNNNSGYPGYIPGGLPSPDLIWEGNKVLDFGVDFTLFDKRLQGTVDWFNRVSNNLIFPVKIPGSTGFTTFNQNIGALRNRGIEVSLGYNVIQKKDFDWRIDVNFTHFTNVFTKLPPGVTEIVDGSNKIMVGHSLYDWWIKESAGVDPATGDALFYKDVLDGNGKATGQRVLTNNANNASFYYQGTAIPKFNGGVTNAFRYKNFDLSVLVTFSQGGKVYDGNFQGIMHPGTFGTAWASEILNRWQKPGDITNVPRLQNAVVGQDGTTSRWLYDASWLNIKNITLSYRIPNSAIRKAGIGGVQIFGNVDNAYLFTAHKGMDPQRSFDGTSDASYTPFRTISFGLNVNL